MRLLWADKQLGLMLPDPVRTILSKYTLGSSASKIQYVSTWRAMSPNDLYMAGLVWQWTNPSLWETNGMRGSDRERRTYLFFWKVRPVCGDLLANLRSWRLREFSDSRWTNHVGYPIGLKSSYEDNFPLAPLLKQDLGNTGGYFENFTRYTVHLCNYMGSNTLSVLLLASKLLWISLICICGWELTNICFKEQKYNLSVSLNVKRRKTKQRSTGWL